MENPIKRWFHESFGVRGGRNLLAWAVSGGLAYYFWVLPQQQDEARRKAIVEEWKQKYADDPTMYPVDRIKAVHKPADPLISGLVLGNKPASKATEEQSMQSAAAPAGATAAPAGAPATPAEESQAPQKS